LSIQTHQAKQRIEALSGEEKIQILDIECLLNQLMDQIQVGLKLLGEKAMGDI